MSIKRYHSVGGHISHITSRANAKKQMIRGTTELVKYSTKHPEHETLKSVLTKARPLIEFLIR